MQCLILGLSVFCRLFLVVAIEWPIFSSAWARIWNKFHKSWFSWWLTIRYDFGCVPHCWSVARIIVMPSILGFWHAHCVHLSFPKHDSSSCLQSYASVPCLTPFEWASPATIWKTQSVLEKFDRDFQGLQGLAPSNLTGCLAILHSIVLQDRLTSLQCLCQFLNWRRLILLLIRT